MIPARLLVHTATVEPYDGNGGYGTAYDLPCYLEQQLTQQVRDAGPSDKVLEATVYANLGDDIPTGSRLTIDSWGATVIAVAVQDDKGITGLAHREIAVRLWPLTS